MIHFHIMILPVLVIYCLLLKSKYLMHFLYYLDKWLTLLHTVTTLHYELKKYILRILSNYLSTLKGTAGPEGIKILVQS